MVRPQWPYAAAREQILSDESGGCSAADEVAGEARPGQGESPQASAGRFQNNARSNMPITRCGSTRFWGRRMMGKARLRQLSFWTGHLAGFLDQLNLPLNRCSQPRDTRVSPAVLVSKPNKKVAFVARHK